MPVYKQATTAEINSAIRALTVRSVTNALSSSIPTNNVLCWLPDGRVRPANANAQLTTKFAGITARTLGANQTDEVIFSGLVPDILTGMGAQAGQPVYMDSTPGGITLNRPPLPNGLFIIGTAVAKTGTLTPAVDLLINFVVESNPPA